MDTKLAKHLSEIKMAKAEKKYISNQGYRQFLKKAYHKADRQAAKTQINFSLAA